MNNQSADGGIEEAEKILQTVIQKFREYLTAQTVVAQERYSTSLFGYFPHFFKGLWPGK